MSHSCNSPDVTLFTHNNDSVREVRSHWVMRAICLNLLWGFCCRPLQWYTQKTLTMIHSKNRTLDLGVKYTTRYNTSFFTVYVWNNPYFLSFVVNGTYVYDNIASGQSHWILSSGFMCSSCIRICHDFQWYLPISFGAKYPISLNQSLTYFGEEGRFTEGF